MPYVFIEEWEKKFPEVNFNDKIVVVYKDGTEKTFKHLYFDSTRLDDVDWNSVSEVHEV